MGLVHRDLKLDNIMMNNSQKIRIIDFGLSISIDGEKLSGLVCTAHYIAPEVLSGKYDEKCDIWSLGIITYLLFSQG